VRIDDQHTEGIYRIAGAAHASGETGNEGESFGSGTITLNIGCKDCGYNLRSLRLDARCPECNGAVAASIAAWQERWQIAISPGRRAALLAGALALLAAAVVVQTVNPYGEYGLAFMAGATTFCWMGLLLVTAVRWDSDTTRWATVPRAARLLATVSVVISWSLLIYERWVRHWVSAFDVIACLNVHLTVLATMLLYIHVARVAGKLGWTWISRQALVLTILLAVGAAFELLKGRNVMLPGIGAPFIVRELFMFWSNTSSPGSPFAARVEHLMHVIGINLVHVPMLIATVAAAVFIAQLAIAAATRSRPPRVNDDG
jgi:hypothetical protein